MDRGVLRIYLGAAPGVGKTVAMLDEGRRRAERGTDVVVGLVETHGRPGTEERLGPLDVIPPRPLDAGGGVDVDAILRRRPALVLVDELAADNLPGAPRAKRWQDVEELLAAGISVVATLNVFHLESLNDVVERIVGTRETVTIPDRVVKAAEQIELVDMTPEALRRRLAHGNIHPADKVDAAVAHWFRSGNLVALRELALRWVAERVDDDLDSYRQDHRITVPWETHERVLVALTGAPDGDRLIRRGARIASRSHAELVGVHVRRDSEPNRAEPNRADAATSDSADRLAGYRELTESLGGRYVEVTGTDIADVLVTLARTENATQIVLGATRRSRFAEAFSGSVVHDVIGHPHAVDVHVVAANDEPADRWPPRLPIPLMRRRNRAAAWVVALLGVPLLALALAPLHGRVETSGVLLLLLLGPVVVAVRGGLVPALAASVAAFISADVLFIEPQRSLGIGGPEDLLSLVVFAGVSGLVSVLVDRLDRRTDEVARQRVETEALARLARQTAVLDPDALARLVDELRSTLALDGVAVLAPAGPSGPAVGGWNVQAASGTPLAAPGDGTFAADLGDGAVLVAESTALTAADRRMLDAFAARVRVAQAAAVVKTEATQIQAQSAANDLRDAILAAVSHDFRGPLANIKAAATSLTSAEVTWGPDAVDGFATTIDAEADRLTALVENLLDLSRLRTGMLGVRSIDVAPAEVIYAALASLAGETPDVDIDAPEDLPFVTTDPALLERAVANLIRNALDWSPPDQRVHVEAAAVEDRVHLRIVDRGPGIPVDQRASILRPFQRLGDSGRVAGQGVGLGLAVADGLSRATGAVLHVEDTPGGGTTVVISVPLADHDGAMGSQR